MKIHSKQVLLVLLIIATILLPSRAYAQEQSMQVCGGDYTIAAAVSLDQGVYDVYVKIGDESSSKNVSIYSQEITQDGSYPSCMQVASSNVVADKYSWLKTITVSTKNITNYLLSESGSQDTTNISQAQLVFVEKHAENSPCDIAAGCNVNYEGVTMELSPIKVSSSLDMLRVGLIKNYQEDVISSVLYSVDGKQVYKLKELKPFNENYVAGGRHTLTRTVVLQSGMTLRDTKEVDRGTTADLHYTAMAFVLTNSKPFIFFGSIILLLVLLQLLKLTLRMYAKKRLWQQTHTASIGKAFEASKVGAQAKFYDESIGMTLYRYRKIVGALLGVSLISLLCVTYVVGVFTVDGVSMNPTLQDRAVHPLVKMRKTIATMGGSVYVPKRGTVVVLLKHDTSFFNEDIQPTKQYVVKRVIGLPGDRVTIKSGVIKIYNNENQGGFVPDETFDWISDTTGSEYFNIDVILKENEIFVVGDNRDESIDSRFYGPVNADDIVGTVVY